MIITQELENVANKFLKDAFARAIEGIIAPNIWKLLNGFSNAEEAIAIVNLNNGLREVAIKALKIAIP